MKTKNNSSELSVYVSHNDYFPNELSYDYLKSQTHLRL